MIHQKVLILYNRLFHYRIPIFKLLAEYYDLTVAFSEGPVCNENLNFKTMILPIHRFNRFVIHKDNIYKLCKNYDVIIAYGDIAWLKYSTLPWHRNRKFKIIFWSIGVSASYDKAYDSIKKWDRIRDYFYKKADALVFYTDYPFKNYIKRGFSREKLFVAPNTVEVIYNEVNKTQKKILLFIGTLYMQKGLLSLMESYNIAYKSNALIPNLSIVGGGEEFDVVQNWIVSNNLSKKIILHGPVFDINEKAKFFQRSLACISPDQAGLSVLESMGYGVPFITNKDSITGGERLNIIDGENGILLDNTKQLAEIILDIYNSPQKYVQMGINAQEYYNKCRKPIDMANGLSDAIQYVSI
jgi:glycosyltransferase involved in cell wall biosynthesis